MMVRLLFWREMPTQRLTGSTSIFLRFQCQPPSGIQNSKPTLPSAFLTSTSKTGMSEKRLEGLPTSDDGQHAASRAKGLFKWAFCCDIYQQLRLQVSHDLWWIALAVICITVTEQDHYQLKPLNYSTFKVIFEVVSAYSCVGVSIGYPGKTYSFCGEWHTFSKLVLAGIALLGKHRGLPLVVDNALSLRQAQD